MHMRIIRNTLSALLVFLFAAACKQSPDVKYVFYVIGDGMGINHVIGAQEYNEATGNGPAVINFAQFPVRGFVTTVSATSLVTDSAAGGTALATGVKTYNSAVGVDKDGASVSCLTEWAAAAGAGVGIATNVAVNHATPACFFSHTSRRGNYEDIAIQYMSAHVDFAAGAGFICNKNSGHDQSYFEQMATDAGIAIFKGADAFRNISAVEGRVLCLSGKPETDLPYAIDRGEDDTALSDFVDAGIRYLEKNYEEKGFFFMLEGGKIDYGGHADDGATCFQEVSDLADAMDLILAFYERHPSQTLIVVTADHETGGLMLGSGQYEMHPERLGTQKCSMAALTDLFRERFFPEGKPYKAPSWEQVRDFFRENLGLWDQIEVEKEAEEALRKTYGETFGKNGRRDLSEVNLYHENSKLVAQAVKYLNKTAGYGWSYTSHSGSPVGLYVKGVSSESFLPIKDNTEIAPMIATLAGYTR